MNMEEETKKNTEEVLSKVKEETEKVLEKIVEDGLQSDNVDLLYKIIDIHKDVANEEYWKGKEEYYMRYRGYEDDSYGRRGVKGTGRYSRYRGEGSYGRRGVPGTGRYRGHDMIDEMHEHYGNYSEGKEMMDRGRYGAEEEATESLECMLESMVDFLKAIKDEADSQEEISLIKKYSRKISEI